MNSKDKKWALQAYVGTDKGIWDRDPVFIVDGVDYVILTLDEVAQRIVEYTRYRNEIWYNSAVVSCVMVEGGRDVMLQALDEYIATLPFANVVDAVSGDRPHAIEETFDMKTENGVRLFVFQFASGDKFYTMEDYRHE